MKGNGIIAGFFCDPKSPQDEFDVAVKFTGEDIYPMSASDFFVSATLVESYESEKESFALAREAITSRVHRPKKVEVDVRPKKVESGAVDYMKNSEVDGKGPEKVDAEQNPSPSPSSSQQLNPTDTSLLSTKAADKAEEKRLKTQATRQETARKKLEKKEATAAAAARMQTSAKESGERRSRAFCCFFQHLFYILLFFCSGQFLEEKKEIEEEVLYGEES